MNKKTVRRTMVLGLMALAALMVVQPASAGPCDAGVGYNPENNNAGAGFENGELWYNTQTGISPSVHTSCLPPIVIEYRILQ